MHNSVSPSPIGLRLSIFPKLPVGVLPMRNNVFTLGVVFAVLLLRPVMSTAEIKMPSIFGDHMVLQQALKLPVWGTADPGETVTVSIGEYEKSATADAGGNWRVDLDPLRVSHKPLELRISGKNEIRFSDVLVGDVWLCSGQSNMEFGIGNAANAAQSIPQMNYPEIRMFLVSRHLAFEPQRDVKQQNLKGQWVVCTPENVTKIGGWNGFSAVALFYAREIFERRREPLGLIGSYWGGTPVQAWTSLQALQAEPPIAHFGDEFGHTKANFSAILEKYRTETLPKWQKDHEAWKQTVSTLPAGAARPKEPGRPESPDAYPNFPAVLFNGMINPLIPYGIKGVIWYQGESSGSTVPAAREYIKIFQAMIADWRRRWEQGDFPFLYVQLPGWSGGYFWIYVREAQLQTLALPNTGMAIAIDLGEEHEVHPKNKLEVSRRLSLVARHVAYGEDLVYSGPIFSSYNIENDKVRVRFVNIGSGLTIGAAPAAGGKPAADQLYGFEIAGADKLFSPANARIDGDSVVVWSDKIAQPKIVRYAHAGFPKPPVNLYNKEGLPASPFITSTGAPVLSGLQSKPAGPSTAANH